jgi:hypothetical protein
MELYTIDLRWNYSDSPSGQLVCTFKNLGSITYILDNSNFVLEYKISSGSGAFTQNHFGFQCNKLVQEFDWSK